VTDDDDAWIDDLEGMPSFIVSQWRVGHVITGDDYKAAQALVSEVDGKEQEIIEAFHNGRVDAYRRIGGEDLVTAVQMDDDERIARISRNAIDRLFPKRPKVMQ
jgi:hypothetical protein